MVRRARLCPSIVRIPGEMVEGFCNWGWMISGFSFFDELTLRFPAVKPQKIRSMGIRQFNYTVYNRQKIHE